MVTPKYADHVWDLTPSTGTGTVTVNSTPPSGYQTFSTKYNPGDIVPYTLQQRGANLWEVGVGTWLGSNQLARNVVVYDGSSGVGALVNFTAGVKDCYVSQAAEEIGGRVPLTAATTFYFRTDGSDSLNRALVATTDSAGTAFATPQFAYNTVAAIYDFSGFPVTIRAGNEAGTKTFTGPAVGTTWIGGGEDLSTPGFPNITFQGNGSGGTTFTDSVEGDSVAVLANVPGNICLRAMTITSVTGSCINNNSSGTVILDTDVVFGAAAAAHLLQSGPGGITWTGNYTINGGASRHMLCGDGAIGDQFFPPFVSSVVTINGTLTINAFAASSNAGAVVINATTYNVTGSVHGIRWQVNGGSIISTYNSTSLSFFPGDQNGVFDQGGGTYNPYPHSVTEAGNDYFYACNGNLLSDPNGHTFLWQGGFLGWSAANPVIVGPPASTFETGWARDGSYHIGQRSSTNAQKYDVYNTWTNASNWERFTIDWQTAANTVILGTEELGTGVARDMRLQTGGLEALRIDTSQFVTVGGFANANGFTGTGNTQVQIQQGDGVYALGIFQYNGTTVHNPFVAFYQTNGVSPATHGAVALQSSTGGFDFFADNGSTAAQWLARLQCNVDQISGSNYAGRFEVWTGFNSPGPSRVAMIDSSGNTTLGPNGNISVVHASRLQMQVTGTNTWNFSCISYGASQLGNAMIFCRTDGATPFAPVGAVASSDIIKTFNYYGDDGVTGFVEGASLQVIVDGAVAANTVPMRWAFLTGHSPGTLTEALRIDNAQQIFVPGVSTTASAANAVLNNASTPANQLLRSTSSLRYKTRVSEVAAERIDAIAALMPIEFASLATADDPDTRFVGYAAERVAEIDPALVSFDAEGRPDGVMYDRVLLLQLEALRRRVNDLEKEKDSWRRQ